MNSNNDIGSASNRDKKEEPWKRRFKKILTLCISVIAITSSIIAYQSDESRDEAKYENDEFIAASSEESSYSLQYSNSLDLLLYAGDQATVAYVMYYNYLKLNEATDDPVEIEKNNYEAERNYELYKKWADIFFFELTKYTKEQYDTSDESDLIRAMEDFADFRVNNKATQIDMYNEAVDHRQNADQATEQSGTLGLAIILFSISTLLCGIALIPDSKRPKYSILLILITLYAIGLFIVGFA